MEPPITCYFFLFTFLSLVNTDVILVQPHNTFGCSYRCDAQYTVLQQKKCKVVETKAILANPSGTNQTQVKFGIQVDQYGNVQLRCQCGTTSFSDLIFEWTAEQAKYDTLSAELYYFPYNNCNLIGRGPLNYTCPEVDELPCSSPQPKAAISIDTTQKFPRCDIDSCLDYYGYSNASFGCDFYSQFMACEKLTECVSNVTNLKCHSLKKHCPSLKCPDEYKKLCGQTPSQPGNGTWDCTKSETCRLLCPPGSEENWLDGQKQYAAVCNNTNGNWMWNVHKMTSCKRGSCAEIVDNECKRQGTGDVCKEVQHYTQCGERNDCTALVGGTCRYYKAKLCPSLQCPPAPVEHCANSPQDVINGFWSCHNQTCQLDCADGYYVNYQNSGIAPTAATCVLGAWQTNLNVPGCLKCAYGGWSTWSQCTVSCGGGTQARSRTVTGPVSVCAHTSQIQDCNTSTCPKYNCVYGSWSSWGFCTRSCDGGTMTRTRPLISSAPGSVCEETSQTYQCNTSPCSQGTCVYSPWAYYGPCSKPCGGGEMSRTRILEEGLSAVCNVTSESEECNIDPCPGATCTYSSWSGWSNCPVTCGGGTQHKTRTLLNGDPYSCTDTSQQQECATDSCNTVQCNYSQWASWSDCDAPCGGGIQQRTRLSYTSSEDCYHTLQAQMCNTFDCFDSPECEFGQWGDWGACTNQCGIGYQVRTRTVEYTPPGNVCQDTVLARECNVTPCPSHFPPMYYPRASDTAVLAPQAVDDTPLKEEYEGDSLRNRHYNIGY